MTNTTNGWLNIYKDSNVSSAKVVSKVKRITGQKKVGHAGTLDPLACGILPIAINGATKTVDYLMNDQKEYLFTIQFGEERDTGDAEGMITVQKSGFPTQAELENILPKFMGTIEQIPPRYSALKIDGKRAYDLARDGVKFKMKPRQIQIFTLKLVSLDKTNKTATLQTQCGKGTYIRSLGIDIARALNCCGYISYLERLSVGDFHKSNSITLEELEQKGLQESLISINSILHIPSVQIDEEFLTKVQNGNAVLANSNAQDGVVKILFKDEVIGLGNLENETLKPFKMF